MNLIFISTDGVLTNQRQIERLVSRNINHAHDYQKQIDSKKIGLLNLLVRRTEGYVIFSGSWRAKCSVDTLNDMLKRSGATFKGSDITPILYKLDNGKFATPGDEIDYYFNNLNKKEISLEKLNYLILDDRDSYYGKHAKNVIKINYEFGTKPVNIEKALKMLGCNRWIISYNIMNYLKFARKCYLEAAKILTAQFADPELDSPNIVIEPQESLIQKAVELIKSKDPNYFKGVRKIIVGNFPAYGRVESGPGKDPAIIQLNFQRTKNEVTSILRSKNPSISQQEIDDAIVKSLAATITHEKGHVGSFKPESGFAGGESPAEQEAVRMEQILGIK